MHNFLDYPFPLKLKMLRLEAGKSQEEFSTELGISRSCLANYETGKRYPGQEILTKLAELYNVMPDALAVDLPSRRVCFNETEIDRGEKLKALIQERGTTLDVSQLPVEHKLSMMNFYDFILSRQNHKLKKKNPYIV